MSANLAAAFLLLASLGAQSAPLSKGSDSFYNLDYGGAIAEFKKDIAAAPEDPENYNHLAMAILYREMFRFGALESELVSGTNPFLRRSKMNPSREDQQEFEAAISRSMSLAQARLNSSSRDLRALYALGVAYGFRANYNFLVHKGYLDALRDATTARKLHNKVTELDPSNVDARVMQGVHDYVVGSLPWHIKVLGFLAGFRGDKEEGVRTLEYVAAHGNLNRVDAEVLLCAIYRRESRPRKAVPLLESLISRFPRNYLFRFEIAQLYGDLGDKQHALAAIQQVEDLKRSGYPGYSLLPIEKIYYARGTLQFWYNDLDRALGNFKQVTARARDLDLNTDTYAWLRLGQIYDLKGQRALAVEAYRQVVRLAPDSDPAKFSRQYLSTPYRREKAKG